MRQLKVLAFLFLVPAPVHAQVAGKFPPDSLVNTKVIPHDTPVREVVGTMRNISQGLGVRCPFCHVGKEGEPLSQFDFPSDQKRNKRVAREMMWMVQEINHRIDTIPDRPSPGVTVNCRTCHRGVSRPVPLETIVTEATLAGGADSGTRVYRSLRDRFFGRDAYDFGENSLDGAALQVAQKGKADEALHLLSLNEGFFPGSSRVAVLRGDVLLMRADTAAAAAAFREALRRDSTDGEAMARLRAIGAGR
ncbi:MAG TPA: c-type cytochrome [Gemmatimonadales bacterium]|nr:c-type cytochrome [Gemmatimonadales bacterium]